MYVLSFFLKGKLFKVGHHLREDIIQGNTVFFLVSKVPGRMGMIVMLYLISTNVYNSVDDPTSKGFSYYIEIWMIGTQIPILLALVEYGFILYLKKISMKFEDTNEMLELGKPKQKLDDKIKMLDFATMIISFIYFTTFAVIYWIVAIN